MYFIHKDEYPNDKWHKSFKRVFIKRNEDFKLIDLNKFEEFGRVNKNSTLLARFGHEKNEKKNIRKKLNKIYDTWDYVFPPKKAYKLYDNKWKEYHFLKKKGISVLPTEFVKSRRELLKFLVSNQIDFPIVLKKNEGAGANQVFKLNNTFEIDSNIFPVLVQPHISTDFDLRLFFLNNKVFCIKRKHEEEGEFPYGGKWYDTKTDFADPLNHLSKAYIKMLWRTLVKDIDCPTMALDIIFQDGEPRVLEFSYCFSKKQPFQTNHYYTLPDFNKSVYFKDGDYKNFEYIRDVVVREVIKWIDLKQ